VAIDLRKYAPPDDVEWLGEMLEEHRVPQRRVAKAAGLDPSSLSRSLTGTRKLRIPEFAAALAHLESMVPGPVNLVAATAWAARLPRRIIAERSGLPPQRVSNLLMGRGEPATQHEAESLDRALGIVAEHGLNRDARSEQPRDAYAEKQEPYIGVLAAPQPLGGGWFSRPGAVVQYHFRPDPLRFAPGAFAFFIGTEDFAPRYLPGEIVFAHPGRPTVAGHWIFLETSDNRFAIGQIFQQSVEAIDLGLPNGKKLRVPRREIHSTGPIVGTWTD
jgi:hypothetical protein